MISAISTGNEEDAVFRALAYHYSKNKLTGLSARFELCLDSGEKITVCPEWRIIIPADMKRNYSSNYNGKKNAFLLEAPMPAIAGRNILKASALIDSFTSKGGQIFVNGEYRESHAEYILALKEKLGWDSVAEPEFTDDFWICCCGMKNPAGYNNCLRCSRALERLKKANVSNSSRADFARIYGFSEARKHPLSAQATAEEKNYVFKQDTEPIRTEASDQTVIMHEAKTYMRDTACVLPSNELHSEDISAQQESITTFNGIAKVDTSFSEPVEGFCSNCGCKLKAGSAFCHRCGVGTKSGRDKKESERKKLSVDTSEKQEATADTNKLTSISSTAERAKPGKKKIILALVAILAVVAAIIAIAIPKPGDINGTYYAADENNNSYYLKLENGKITSVVAVYYYSIQGEKPLTRSGHYHRNLDGHGPLI